MSRAPHQPPRTFGDLRQAETWIFDLDNTLWPVDEVIRKAEKACSDWIADRHPDAARAQVEEMCARLLANTVIENYDIELDR